MIKIANELVSHSSLPKSQAVDSAAPTPLTTWYLKPVSVGQTRMAIFINEATMAPVLIPAVDVLAVPATQLLRSILGTKLYNQGVPEEKIDQYFEDCFAQQQAVPHTTTDFTLERTYQEYQEILQHEKLDLMQEQESQKLFSHLLSLMDKLVEDAGPLVNNPFINLGQNIEQQIEVAETPQQDESVAEGSEPTPLQAMSQLMGSQTVELLFKELLNPRHRQILDHLLANLSAEERQYLMKQLQRFDK